MRVTVQLTRCHSCYNSEVRPCLIRTLLAVTRMTGPRDFGWLGARRKAPPASRSACELSPDRSRVCRPMHEPPVWLNRRRCVKMTPSRVQERILDALAVAGARYAGARYAGEPCGVNERCVQPLTISGKNCSELSVSISGPGIGVSRNKTPDPGTSWNKIGGLATRSRRTITRSQA